MGTATFSDTGANLALDASVGTGTHISLHTSDPGATGASEASGGGYARQASGWNAASSGLIDNDTKVVWTAASGDTLGGGAVTHYGVYDSVTGGNFIVGGALDSSRTVEDGDKLEIAAGELNLEF